MSSTIRRSRVRDLMMPGVLTAVAAMLATGCDLGVVDTGRIEDADLNNVKVIAPLLAGIEGEFAYATTGERPGGTYGAGAFLTDEIVHSGQFVGMRDWSNLGLIPNDVAETSARWANASGARWLAEEGVRRITTILEGTEQNPATNIDVARAALWAGFGNRVMGDTFCQAVIDGGAAQPVSAFYERGEGYFTDAIAIATAAGNDSIRFAALAGRAQVRMMLGDWVGAGTDAAVVPIGYVHETRHSSNSAREHNGLFNLHINDAQATVWGTPFAEWGREINGNSPEPTEGDPRVSYRVTFTAGGALANGGDGRRPQWQPRKFLSRDANVPVAKGTEMRLIQAEAALQNGGAFATAMNLINDVRGYRSRAALSAANADEAWQHLMKERGIELWLEGRRQPDLRRWAQSQPTRVNSQVVRLENSGNPPSTDERRNVLNNPQNSDGLCLPVSQNEVNSNPNL